jgi:hypothetical protein
MQIKFLKIVYVVGIILIITSCKQEGSLRATPTFLNESGWISKNRYYEKTVYFGTTRPDKYEGLSLDDVCKNQAIIKKFEQDCKRNILRYDTSNKKSSNTEIEYGFAKVKIPFVKDQGETSGMSISFLRNNLSWNNFASNLTDDDLLIVIHGFNTPFVEAVIRTAQIGHDTNFKGEVVLFSWPSDNNISYGIEKLRAAENFELFATFLQGIASVNQDKKINILAHSMGTFVLMNSLVALEKRINNDESILKNRMVASNGKIFNQIILAAPDIAQNDYREKFTKYNLSDLAERFTLYSSQNDYVLRTSRGFNFFGDEGTFQPRVGDSSVDFFTIKGMDTIDTRQEISSQVFGHSFYAEYRSLVTDMHLILNHGIGPDERLLQGVYDINLNKLWFIRD